jgi:sugar (pentulose or hexulose) kinase
VYGIPTETLKVKDAGSLGAAICAAVGVGLYKDLAEGADALAKPDKRYEPISQNVAVYEELYGIYCDIYTALDANGAYLRLAKMQG